MRKRDHNRNWYRGTCRRIIGAIPALLLALALCLTPGGAARAAEAEESQGNKKLTITVVEDIPAMDIEESDVPLAALPNTAQRSGVRHAGCMGCALIAVIAYVIYFRRYDRRLYVLRREAARAEYRRMLRRTGGTAEKAADSSRPGQGAADEIRRGGGQP